MPPIWIELDRVYAGVGWVQVVIIFLKQFVSTAVSNSLVSIMKIYMPVIFYHSTISNLSKNISSNQSSHQQKAWTHLINSHAKVEKENWIGYARAGRIRGGKSWFKCQCTVGSNQTVTMLHLVTADSILISNKYWCLCQKIQRFHWNKKWCINQFNYHVTGTKVIIFNVPLP